jgi:hypothetical protein
MQNDCSAEGILWLWTPDGGHIYSRKTWLGWLAYISAEHFQWVKLAFDEVQHKKSAHFSQIEYTPFETSER